MAMIEIVYLDWKRFLASSGNDLGACEAGG